MIHIKAGKNVDICVEDGRVVGLNVKTADGRVFVHLPQPETFLEVFSKTIKECSAIARIKTFFHSLEDE